MNDLISRQEVIKLIDELGYVNCFNNEDFKANYRVDKIRQRIMELPIVGDEEKELIEKHFGNAITVKDIVNAFVDFYIKQEVEGKVAKARLLTNECVDKWEELKERYMMKELLNYGDENEVILKCQGCEEDLTDISECGFNFCLYCGQRLR